MSIQWKGLQTAGVHRVALAAALAAGAATALGSAAAQASIVQGGSLSATGTNTIGYTGNIYEYTVPESGIYKILAYGANGGGGGGLGAEMGGDVSLTQGEIIEILAGGSGGGGGSFVVEPGSNSRANAY